MKRKYTPSNFGLWTRGSSESSILILLLFAMIRSVVKSFKVPDVEVAAARMSNESALTHDLLDTKKNLGQT